MCEVFTKSRMTVGGGDRKLVQSISERHGGFFVMSGGFSSEQVNFIAIDWAGWEFSILTGHMTRIQMIQGFRDYISNLRYFYSNLKDATIYICCDNAENSPIGKKVEQTRRRQSCNFLFRDATFHEYDLVNNLVEAKAVEYANSMKVRDSRVSDWKAFMRAFTGHKFAKRSAKMILINELFDLASKGELVCDDVHVIGAYVAVTRETERMIYYDGSVHSDHLYIVPSAIPCDIRFYRNKDLDIFHVTCNVTDLTKWPGEGEYKAVYATTMEEAQTKHVSIHSKDIDTLLLTMAMHNNHPVPEDRFMMLYSGRSGYGPDAQFKFSFLTVFNQDVLRFSRQFDQLDWKKIIGLYTFGLLCTGNDYNPSLAGLTWRKVYIPWIHIAIPLLYDSVDIGVKPNIIAFSKFVKFIKFLTTLTPTEHKQIDKGEPTKTDNLNHLTTLAKQVMQCGDENERKAKQNEMEYYLNAMLDKRLATKIVAHIKKVDGNVKTKKSGKYSHENIIWEQHDDYIEHWLRRNVYALSVVLHLGRSNIPLFNGHIQENVNSTQWIEELQSYGYDFKDQKLVYSNPVEDRMSSFQSSDESSSTKRDSQTARPSSPSKRSKT
jgi:hypothetical protein